jgi:hypothetical protein
MKWTRGFLSFGLVLALLGGVSCTTADTNPFEPVAEPVLQQSQPLLLDGLLGGTGGLLGTVTNVVGGVINLAGGLVNQLLNVTGLLTCQQQQYDVEYETVGPWGGTIRVGTNALVIPRGALRSYVRIKAEQIPGSTNSVRFSPEGLQFSTPATLVLNYQNCQNVDVPKSIVYTSEQLEVLEILKSLDVLKARTIAAPIDHFSRYAVAY